MTTSHTILYDLAHMSTDARDKGNKQGPAGLPRRLPAMVDSLAEGDGWRPSITHDGRLALRKD